MLEYPLLVNAPFELAVPRNLRSQMIEVIKWAVDVTQQALRSGKERFVQGRDDSV